MPGAASVTALRARHDDEFAHSSHDCALSTRIFIGTQPVTLLSSLSLPILQAAALLHDIGAQISPDYHGEIGRDLILATNLRGFTETERDMIATIVSFHRGSVEAANDPAWSRLDAESRLITLKLASILRIADGLDYLHEQSVDIADISIGKRIRFYVRDRSGTGTNVQRARNKSDLWNRVIAVPDRFELTSRRERPWRPHLESGKTLAQTAQDAMRGYFSGVIAHSARSGLIEGIDARHDIRVNLRRLRWTLRLYRRIWVDDITTDLDDELRWLGELLGSVRDRDVSLRWLSGDKENRDADMQEPLDGLCRDVRRERRVAMAGLHDGLRSDRYKALLRRMNSWIEEGSAAFENFSERAYRTVSREVLRVLHRHSLRIAVKGAGVSSTDVERIHILRKEARRMRYTIETWYNALGPGRRRLYRDLLEVQDALGDVHDADVRSGHWGNHTPEFASWLDQRNMRERDEAWQRFTVAWPRLLRHLHERSIDRVVDN